MQKEHKERELAKISPPGMHLGKYSCLKQIHGKNWHLVEMIIMLRMMCSLVRLDFPVSVLAHFTIKL